MDKAATPIRISSLLTSRHLSNARLRLPVRKYHPKEDHQKVRIITWYIFEKLSESNVFLYTCYISLLIFPDYHLIMLQSGSLLQWSRRDTKHTQGGCIFHAQGESKSSGYSSFWTLACTNQCWEIFSIKRHIYSGKWYSFKPLPFSVYCFIGVTSFFHYMLVLTELTINRKKWG